MIQAKMALKPGLALPEALAVAMPTATAGCSAQKKVRPTGAVGVLSVYPFGLQHSHLLTIKQHIHSSSVTLMLLCWVSWGGLLLL